MAVRRRRRMAALLGFVAVVTIGFAVVMPVADRAVKEVTLPLRHEDIIRQQARDKDLDPSLIAAVIYAESHFRDQTSHAGARGLMQITPADGATRSRAGRAARSSSRATSARRRSTSPTAPGTCAGCSSATARTSRSRSRPTTRGPATSTSGSSTTRAWTPRDIPFPETRAYVAKVMDARGKYRTEYRRELGL